MDNICSSVQLYLSLHVGKCSNGSTKQSSLMLIGSVLFVEISGSY
jgi:hypothetical protein